MVIGCFTFTSISFSPFSLKIKEGTLLMEQNPYLVLPGQRSPPSHHLH